MSGVERSKRLAAFTAVDQNLLPKHRVSIYNREFMILIFILNWDDRSSESAQVRTS